MAKIKMKNSVTVAETFHDFLTGKKAAGVSEKKKSSTILPKFVIMRMKSTATQNMRKKHLCRIWNCLLPKPILLRTVRKQLAEKRIPHQGNCTYTVYLKMGKPKYTAHTLPYNVTFISRMKRRGTQRMTRYLLLDIVIRLHRENCEQAGFYFPKRVDCLAYAVIQ